LTIQLPNEQYINSLTVYSAYTNLYPAYHIEGNIRRVQISFFSFSVYQNENLTHETYVMMGVLSGVKCTEQKLNAQIS